MSKVFSGMFGGSKPPVAYVPPPPPPAPPPRDADLRPQPRGQLVEGAQPGPDDGEDVLGPTAKRKSASRSILG